MDAYETINDVLVNLFNEILKLEEEAMSAVAKKLGITAGSLTTAVNSLVNKKYVVRRRSDEDRRVVFIGLTPKGVRAYDHHKDYHRQMTEAVISNLNEEEIPVLLKTLNGLSEFFRGYQRKI